MKVALVCIGRLENKYVVEFVEHYKQLEFDHLYIADNNHDGEEYFEDVLQQYINDQFVTIINYRNQITKENDKFCIQIKAYNDIYDKYHSDYDYMMFIDMDEYLILTKDKTIKEYLSRNINNYDGIFINWMIMTDNNLIYNDNRPLLEKFNMPMKYDKLVSNDHIPENWMVKSIIRCKNKLLYIDNPHGPHYRTFIKNQSKICNNKFDNVNLINYINNRFMKCDYTLAYIKHFCTKTIEEYVNIKMKRLTPDRTPEAAFEKYNLTWFFKINEKTEEKIEYLKTKGIL